MSEKGFRPQNKLFENRKKSTDKYELGDFDSTKLYYLEAFVKETDNITNLILVVSPRWYGLSTKRLIPLFEIANKYKIPLYDYSNKKKYVGNEDLFYDGIHLNSEGANVFTEDLLQDLRNYIKLQK